MAESTVVYTPESSSAGTVPAWLAMNNGNGLFGGNGWGGGILGFLLGLFFGNGWGGIGGFGGNGAGGTGFLSNQISNDAGRDLLMSAITSNGEASRSAISSLSTMLGQDFNIVNSGVSAIRDGIASLTTQTGMSSLQIINAIQSGNSSLAASLSQCCCENRLLTTQQGYESQIRTLEQTNLLGSQADRNTNSIIGAINAQTVAMNDGFCAIKERELQDKIDALAASNTVLRTQLDNAAQTSAIAAMLAPINAKLVELESKQPSTVPVVWPQLTVSQTTPTTTA